MHLTFARKISECPVCESSSVRRSRRKGFVERFVYGWRSFGPTAAKAATRVSGVSTALYPLSHENSAFVLASNDMRSGALQG